MDVRFLVTVLDLQFLAHFFAILLDEPQERIHNIRRRLNMLVARLLTTNLEFFLLICRQLRAAKPPNHDIQK